MKNVANDQYFQLFEIRVKVRQLLEDDYFITRDAAILAEIDKARERINEVFDQIKKHRYDS